MFQPAHDRYWFSFLESKDGTCAYTFHDLADPVATGTADSPAAVLDAFDAFVKSKAH